MIISTRSLTESLEKKYSLKESYWWEDWENLPKERTDEISKWAKNYVNEICKYDLRNYDITGPKFEDSNEKFTVIINNKIFNFDWEDIWVNKAYYDENREENLPDDYEYIYDTIDDDPIGYRIISTIESTNGDPKYAVDYSDGKLDESLNEGWMPLNKLSRYHNVADEFQVNDKLEIRNTKTGKIRTFTTNRGGQADDKVTVNTKDGKTTSVAKETLKDEIETLRSENLGKSPFTLTDSLNESFVEEWWGQTDEDPFDFAYEYGLTCKEIGRQGDEILYRFTGEKEDFDEAKADGYFYSIAFGGDEGHSEDLNESLLVEAENPDNADINALIRKVIGKKNISKKDAQALADAGIERDEYGDLTGKNGRRLTKWGSAIHGPGKTYYKYPKTDYRKGHDAKTTRWDLRKNSADMAGRKHADKWDKVDLKNYLDSEKPDSEWETEQEMDKKLRPYSDKYQELKRQKANAEWDANWDSEKIKSEEEIEKLVQEYRDKLMKQRAYHMKELEKEEGSREYYDKQIKDLQAQAKAKHPQYESLNEAQLNENPLIAAAARAAIPAAIDVASNAISSAIDAKLHDGNNLEEDFFDPTSWFYDLVNNYETWSGEEWNNWSQEERDAAVTKAMKHFLIDNQLSEEEAEEFKHDLADNNFHTECRIFSELYGTI